MNPFHCSPFAVACIRIPPQDTWADFDPDNASMTCTADTHAHPFNVQLRGTNIGSWMVLEPWITPSLFYQVRTHKSYQLANPPSQSTNHSAHPPFRPPTTPTHQFLGKTETTTAMDMYSFCDVLGPEEGNKQLRRHWDTWVTEDDVKELASHNINSLRLPVGDWMYDPYGPYVGCTDGSLEYVEWFLDLCDEYGISVLIDIHGVIDSQNGFDNSGQSQGLEWTSVESTEPVGVVTFEHWPIRSAGWMGEFDPHGFYTSIKHENINRVLGTIGKVQNGRGYMVQWLRSAQLTTIDYDVPTTTSDHDRKRLPPTSTCLRYAKTRPTTRAI